MSVVAAIDAQTLVDAVGLGAVYALMAVGIGLVFGVLRLVNFAYGQLIMAGAFSLAVTSEHGWPDWASLLTCFAVVIALSLLMEVAVFRPLRNAPPATASAAGGRRRAPSGARARSRPRSRRARSRRRASRT